MSRASLESAIPAGAGILLDTSVLLAYLEGDEPASGAAALVLDTFVRGGRNRATISAVSVAETLVRPSAAGPAALAIAEAFLLHFPGLAVAGVDYAIAREAARLRAETGLGTPDALIVATALGERIPVVVSNDARWRGAIARGAPELDLVPLDAHLTA
ncbi:MAG: type II toxin-antitoxin system VapC family toxin [Candidatus Limnocylindrales bacterium]